MKGVDRVWTQLAILVAAAIRPSCLISACKEGYTAGVAQRVSANVDLHLSEFTPNPIEDGVISKLVGS